MQRNIIASVLASSLLLACSDDSGGDMSTSAEGSDTQGDGDGDSSDQESSESMDTGDGDGDTMGDGDGDDPGDGDGDGDTMGDGDGDTMGDGDGDTMGDGDGDGDGCQPAPELCPMGTECDVISGECLDPELPCTLSGPSTTCGDFECGPGSVCDDQGGCIPVAPCSAVDCEGDQCWGAACICDRPMPCDTASVEALNGPFATDIFDLEFADDCTAWMVTLRSGTDYLRRMTPDETLTEWAGVANLNMGEVKVLKALVAPQLPAPEIDDLAAPDAGEHAGPALPVGGEDLGEVAITYTCCPSCGCFVDPPQGVARLIEGDIEPLPIVLPAVPTQGLDGPFGSTPGDAGPMGLTWGDDLRLYVGNSEANGNFDTVDLDAQSQDFLTMFGSRVTAAAPLTPVHLLVALDTGELLRFNTATLEATSVVDLGVGVTTLSHDSFTGEVYASLSDLSIVVVDPFSGETADFGEAMPNLGRVAVSPDGKLWWVPAKFVIGNMPLSNWDLPASF